MQENQRTSQNETQLQKERQAIAYIRAHLSMEDTKAIEHLLVRLEENQTFVTPEGKAFLMELRKKVSLNNANTSPQAKKQLARCRRQVQLLLVVCVVLLAMIAGMFAITLTSDNPTILDYEEKLIDRYASWEEELTQREKAVTQKEQELSEKEAQIGTQESSEAVQKEVTDVQEDEAEPETVVQE